MDDQNQNPAAEGMSEGTPAAKMCSHCGKATSGYKCDMCGAEAAEHDATHACGADHCVAKCAACNQAESSCTCPSEGDTTPPSAPAV